MIKKLQVQTVVDRFNLNDLDKQHVTEFIIRTWKGETKEILIIEGEPGTGKMALLKALRTLCNLTCTLFVNEWEPNKLWNVSTTLTKPVYQFFQSDDKTIKEMLANSKKIILTTELDQIPAEFIDRKMTKVTMEPFAKSSDQQIALYLARRLMSQIDNEENANSPLWIVSIISKLATAFPHMTLEQLQRFTTQEMPVHSALYCQYVRES